MPSFFQRANRLGESNYHQFLLEKHFGDRVLASADYTFDKKTHITRQAAFVKVPEIKVLDSSRIELYQRLNDVSLAGLPFYSRNGFAVTGAKTFHKTVKFEGGWAKIAPYYGVLTGYRVAAVTGFSMNGDPFMAGERAL